MRARRAKPAPSAEPFANGLTASTASGILPRMPTIDVLSPMAGSIKEMLVTIGDVVTVEQELLVIESMKMEIPLESQAAGTVSELLVHPADRISEGQVLLRLETP